MLQPDTKNFLSSDRKYIGWDHQPKMPSKLLFFFFLCGGGGVETLTQVRTLVISANVLSIWTEEIFSIGLEQLAASSSSKEKTNSQLKCEWQYLPTLKFSISSVLVSRLFTSAHECSPVLVPVCALQCRPALENNLLTKRVLTRELRTPENLTIKKNCREERLFSLHKRASKLVCLSVCLFICVLVFADNKIFSIKI